jgi:ribosomal protein S18 acetylase RimI-like enzyme
MQITADPWLAEVLGRDVFRVAWTPTDEDVRAGEQTLRNALASARGPAFFYAKVPTSAVASVGAMTSANFRVVDVNTTFERTPAADSGRTADGRITVRDILPAEHEAVLEIAATSFEYTRFHLDPHLPRRLADAVKREWVRNYVQGRRGERLAVAVLDRRTVGFLAVLAPEHHGKPCRVIDLIAVDRACQGRGVGRALVEAFVASSTGVCDLLRVGTQAANIASMRLYEACGFRIVETAYVLHAHVPGKSGHEDR